MLGHLQKVNSQVWVAIGSVTIIGLSAVPVFKSDVRPGHDLFSSEKPEAIRESEVAKRKEYRRLIKEQRKQIQLDKERFMGENNDQK